MFFPFHRSAFSARTSNTFPVIPAKSSKQEPRLQKEVNDICGHVQSPAGAVREAPVEPLLGCRPGVTDPWLA